MEILQTLSLHSLLLGSHIGAGVLALVSGIIPMITFKGGKLHRLSGRLYFWSMFWLFFTTIISFFFFRGNFFLLVIGVFSFHVCFTGYRVLYRKKPGQETWLDWSAAILTLLAGIGIEIYGIWLFLNVEFGTTTLLSIIFGLLTISNALSEIKLFRMTHVDDKMWWFYHHMSAMCGAFIATLTAFLVNAVGPFFYEMSIGWVVWLLPVIIGSPGITFWQRYYKKKFNKDGNSKRMPAPSDLQY